MNARKILGFAAVAGLLFVAAPTQQASAASLASPAAAAAVQGNPAEGLTTQVQYRRGWHGGWRRHGGWHRHGWGRPHGWGHRRWR
jgi:hypothetical protein